MTTSMKEKEDAGHSHRSRAGRLTDQIARIFMPALYLTFLAIFTIVVVASGPAEPMSDVEYVTSPYG